MDWAGPRSLEGRVAKAMAGEGSAAAQRWAECGGMYLTGFPDRQPLIGPARVALGFDALAAQLADSTTRLGRTVSIDGAALIGERAGGRLRPARFEAAKMLWARMWEAMAVVLADEALVAAACHAAARHRLRGYDAIHLAAASQAGCDLFVCSDGKLLGAARASGLTILDLNAVT